ncbi:hypothetical protein Tsubulata_006229 [Turnera subulata]|uniref:Protein FLX-like 4 n=1 Tax=Turnera subulata TaxID=218843 RepID=A0A9Q0FKL6_9ROSI|nr:hypothetical protein Tsubulata_006229 [Turnera subulata]
MRQGSFSAGLRPLDQIPHQDLLENKVAAQAAEIERLSAENRRLANSHVVMRDDLVNARQEAQRLGAHIRSIPTESDIQIRVLAEKIKKMEAGIKAGENVRNDLKQAHSEAQSLVKARQELTLQIQQSSQELQRLRADVKSLSNLDTELENLRHEVKMLRATFEREKSLNIEKVERLRAREQNLIQMAREVERLRAEVTNAEKIAHVPNFYSGGYSSHDPAYLHAVGGSSVYVNAYGRHQIQTNSGPAVDGTSPYCSGGQ